MKGILCSLRPVVGLSLGNCYRSVSKGLRGEKMLCNAICFLKFAIHSKASPNMNVSCQPSHYDFFTSTMFLTLVSI